MFNWKRNASFAGLMVCGLALAACGGVDSGGADGSVKIRASTPLPPGGSQSELMAWFLDELEGRTNGEVETELVYGGALVSGDDTLAALNQGRAEAGLLGPSYFPAEMPLSNMNNIPHVGAIQAARGRAMSQIFNENDHMAEELKSNGVVMLGYLPNTTSTVAVNTNLETLADLDGMRIRIPAQHISVAYAELGAEPVFMATEETYEAVERGIVEGTTFPLDVQVSNGISEVAETIATDVGQSGGALFAISQKTYDKLSDDAKTVIEDLRAEWDVKSDELLTQYEDQACEAILEEGAKVVVWTGSEQDRLKQIVQDKSVSFWKSEAGRTGLSDGELDELWSDYSDMVESMKGKTEYVDVMESCGQ